MKKKKIYFEWEFAERHNFYKPCSAFLQHCERVSIDLPTGMANFKAQASQCRCPLLQHILVGTQLPADSLGQLWSNVLVWSGSANKLSMILNIIKHDYVISFDNLSQQFSLDLVSVTEFPEDCILQVEVIIDIHMNLNTNEPADLIDQFRD